MQNVIFIKSILGGAESKRILGQFGHNEAKLHYENVGIGTLELEDDMADICTIILGWLDDARAYPGNLFYNAEPTLSALSITLTLQKSWL